MINMRFLRRANRQYTLLNDSPERIGMSRRWKITWTSAVICMVCISFFLYVFDVSLTRFVSIFVILLFFLGCSHYITVKPKTTGRLLYITMGAVLFGLFLWLFLILKLLRGASYFAMYPAGSTGDNIIALLSFVVCYAIGGVIGDLIGRKIQYRWPPFIIDF